MDAFTNNKARFLYRMDLSFQDRGLSQFGLRPPLTDESSFDLWYLESPPDKEDLESPPDKGGLESPPDKGGLGGFF